MWRAAPRIAAREHVRRRNDVRSHFNGQKGLAFLLITLWRARTLEGLFLKHSGGRAMQISGVVLASLALLFSSTPVRANVCGGNVSRYLVPDFVCFDAQGTRMAYSSCSSGKGGGSLVRQRVDFTSPCTQHDSCYGKKGAKKSDCDAAFYKSLNAACRSQVSAAGSEKISRACYETAAQYNDVVRGQATRRMGLWTVQQVPFTGKSGCDAFRDAQTRAGVKVANCD